jgi:hypothetical protein
MNILDISKFCEINVKLGPHEAKLVDAILKENVPDFIVFYSGGGLRNEEENGVGFVSDTMNNVIEEANKQIESLEMFKEEAKEWIDLQKDNQFDLNEESVRANLIKGVTGLFKRVEFNWLRERRSSGFMHATILPTLNVKAFREVVEISGEDLIFHKVNRTKVKFLTSVVNLLPKLEPNQIRLMFKGPSWLAIPKHVDMAVGKANVMSNGVFSKYSRRNVQLGTWEYKDDVWLKSSSSEMRKEYLY